VAVVNWQVDLKPSTVRSTQRNFSVRSLVRPASIHLDLAVSLTLPNPLLDLHRQPRQAVTSLYFV